MNTLNLGIIMDQGADFSLVIGIFGDDKLPLDITGYMFKSQMRASTNLEDDPVADFSFTVLNQTTNKGQVRWTLSKTIIDEIVLTLSTSTENIRQTTPFLFDIKMKDLSDVVSRIVQGIIYVSPQATEEFT